MTTPDQRAALAQELERLIKRRGGGEKSALCLNPAFIEQVIDALRSTAAAQTPNSSLPPLDPNTPARELIVKVRVPENWERRLDMQWVLEREINADRWAWSWPAAAQTSDARARFEAWFSEDGKWPAAIERRGEGYKLVAAETAWTTWQAAIAASGEAG